MNKSQHRRLRIVLCVAFAVLFTISFVPRAPIWTDGQIAGDGLTVRPSDGPQTERRVTTVIASQTKDNTTWLPTAFPDWDHKIYITDDPNAPLSVPRNKGREGMVYLTYIIDNYDELPPIMIFQHANRYQWHNDDPLYDGQRTLSRLRLAHIQQQGYVNLRCVWTLGCPSEIHPSQQVDSPASEIEGADDERAEWYYKTAFERLFPDVEVPDVVGVSCCAQFAATDWMIHKRPKADYERYRDWLVQTELSDYLSGRILEYSWHIIFGMNSVHCPDASRCYCDLYGLCSLECQDGKCLSQYTLPTYSTLPDGWPDYGWDGEWQNATAM